MVNLDDAVLRSTQEPEVVALGSQTLKEVKELFKKSEKAEQLQKKEVIRLAKQFQKEEDKKINKLCYEDELSDCCIPDVSPRDGREFNRDVDIFALWRRLADVKVGDSSLDPQILCNTKDLMDYVLLKLNRSFPDLKLNWSEETWNPCLKINGCPTKVSMEKIAIAYQGLLNIAEELTAQTIIYNIITKKLNELFI